jgi:hypothetical protein
MVNWLIYNSVLPLLPVPLVYFGAWLIGTRRRILSIIRDGQLCFYCTSLSAASINDVFKSGDTHANSTAGLAIAAMIFCMILSTFTYGVAATHSGTGVNHEVKLGIASITTAVVTTLLVSVSRLGLGIS